jgi:hypothetical protein
MIIPINIPIAALARHEAGHAILQVAFDRTLTLVVVEPEKNSGRVAYAPSFETLEQEGAADFAGPLSQILKYGESVQQYREACEKSIIFKQINPRAIPEEYNALNWGHDFLGFFNGPLGLRNEYLGLEIELRKYLIRASVQTALEEVELLLCKNHQPDPEEVRKLISKILSPEDRYPFLSSTLGKCQTSKKISEILKSDFTSDSSVDG